MKPSEPFPHFVSDYLAHLQEVYPGESSLDGVHLYDDLLEDFSRDAIETRGRELGGWARRLEGIGLSGLTPDEVRDRRMLADCIRSRLFAVEEIRDWERNPGSWETGTL